MNDLDHDLRELFDQRAAGIDVPGLAPKQVLKRGRRRQVGTVMTAVLACLAALGIAAIAIGQTRHPAVIPTGNGLPARSTSIGGVPVTAPAGWTLVDDYPFASVYPSDKQTCTFSGTGTPVEGSGSFAEGSAAPPTGSGEGSGTSSPSCTETTTTYAAGIPVLELANFEIPIGQSVCGRGNYLDQAALPPTGVSVYVADTQADPNINALETSCAGSAEALTTFLQAGHHTIYAAIAAVGADASDADIAKARDYISLLSGIEVTPTMPATGQGPGYVVATGTDEGTPWRLEAGIGFGDGNEATTSAGAVMVTTHPSDEVARAVQPSSGPKARDDYSDLGTQAVVQFGTAGPDVTGITVTTASGSTSAATLIAWPDWFTVSHGDLGPINGSVWYAVTPERGSLDVHASSGSSEQSTPTTPPVTSDQPMAGRLQTTTDDQGRYTIFGNDFGHDWSFHRDQDGTFLFFLDGVDQAQGFVLTSGAESYLDIPGGTLALALEPSSLDSLYMTADVAGNDVIANGAWAPSSRGSEQSTRIWVLALPGSGSGYEWNGSRLPLSIDWPTNHTITPGDQIAAGSTPLVSWVEVWSDQGCPTFQVVAAVSNGDLGSAPCPVPWNPQEYANRTSFIGGVYGQENATVWMLGPAGMMADATSPDAPKVGGNCGGSIANAGQWAQTGECIFVIPVGQTWTIHPTLQDGTPLDQTITITAQPGRIKTSQTGGSASPTP